MLPFGRPNVTKGAKPHRRYGRLDAISLLSLEYLLSVCDGPSMRNHRITKAWFPTCSTCRSRSQAPFCLCTRRAIADRAEGTIARLRYCFGGDRPSQTAHLPGSEARIHSPSLGVQCHEGGISPVPPRPPEGTVHRLPPILRTPHRNPTAGYSKGARGLFVLSRVIGILTDTPISPSSWRRQRPSRYAIRAGRNLPDKEFRCCLIRTCRLRHIRTGAALP